MNDKIILALIFGIFCILGTGFGAFLSLFLSIKTKRIKSALLDFSAGLMISVVFLDLFITALKYSNALIVIIGVLIGVFFMIITDSVINSLKSNAYIKTGLILVIGLSLHNLPEGLALGSTINIDKNLFIRLAISIFVHHIPEGILMAIPLKIGGLSKVKILFISAFTGIFALIGTVLGTNAYDFIKISMLLSVASGAMLHAIFFEIIPESKALYKGRFSPFCLILGITSGLFLSTL